MIDDYLPDAPPELATHKLAKHARRGMDRVRDKAARAGGEAQRAARVVVTLPRAPWEEREAQ